MRVFICAALTLAIALMMVGASHADQFGYSDYNLRGPHGTIVTHCYRSFYGTTCATTTNPQGNNARVIHVPEDPNRDGLTDQGKDVPHDEVH